MATKTAPEAPREGVTVEILDGLPCVRVTRVLWSEPIACTWWYPVSLESRADAIALAGVPLVERAGWAGYSVAPEAPEWRASRDVRVFLARGSGTEPARYINQVVPRPARVRADRAKWEHGRWHKLTKRGWQPA